MQIRSAFVSILTGLLCAGVALTSACPATARTVPKVGEIVTKYDKKLTRTIGECACAIDPLSPTADSEPVGKVTVPDFRGSQLAVTVVNHEYALRLFQEMTMQKKISFGFPEDGCFARAYEMSYQFAQKGISTGKVFAHGRFRLADDKAKRGAVQWSFHVAPFLIVDTGQQRQIWVIDPSLFYEPVTLRAWLDALTVHPKAKLQDVYFTSPFVYNHSARRKKLSDFDPEDLKKARRLMKRYRKRQTERERKTTKDL